MVAVGINEQNVGLVKHTGNIKLLFPPSYAAEAHIGLMSKQEIKSGLEEFLEAYHVGGTDRTLPILSKWAKECHGKIDFFDLEERVRAHSEGMAHLINGCAVKSRALSGANVDYAVIRRRGDARKGDERSRATSVVLGKDGEVIDYSCTCSQFKTEFVRGNYDSENSFITHVACYHINVALAAAGASPYRFDDVSVVIESLAMKVFRKTSKKAFLRDKFLLSGKIFTEASHEGLNNGELTVEVIWNKRNIKGRPKSIINGLKSYFETDNYGYRFSGFALDFQNTPYETTAIVLAKEGGRSVHILYDDALQTEGLPFFMLKIPKPLWLESGRPADLEQLNGRNPVLYSKGRLYFEDFDQRTQSEMVAIVSKPVAQLLRNEEKLQYDRILSSTA